mgnify:CR=1 FL=1
MKRETEDCCQMFLTPTASAVTTAAVIITEQGLDLLGRSDRRVYLPKSQIQIKGDVLHGYEIFIPEWLIIKNRINWNRIQEIEPIDPPRRTFT